LDPKPAPTLDSSTTDAPVLACHRCQTVSTDNGQKVWVCQNCGEENHAPAIDEKAAQAVIDAAATIPLTPGAKTI